MRGRRVARAAMHLLKSNILDARHHSYKPAPKHSNVCRSVSVKKPYSVHQPLQRVDTQETVMKSIGKELVEELASVVEHRGHGAGDKRKLAEILRRAADVCEEEYGSDCVLVGGEEVEGYEQTGAQKRVVGAVDVLGGSLCDPCNENGGGSSPRPALKKTRRGKRQSGRRFDITKYKTRFVALQMSYVGCNFHGYACQDHNDNTIEEYFFKALRMTRLISDTADFKDLKYSRCGRTDKGVSALGQVVALKLRSSAKLGEEDRPAEREIDYPKVINSVLPPEIRILGWAPASDSFDARRSATYRVYKYIILDHEAAPLNIEAMQEAAACLIGIHDFRNFCKVDVRQTTQFIRHLMECRIDPVDGIVVPGTRVYVLTAKGSSYLWHQIRCMVSVLMLVGRGKEDPSVVQELLDVDKVQSKPQFKMASELPLVLYECGFSEELNFIRSTASITHALETSQTIADSHTIGSGIMKYIMDVVGAFETMDLGRAPRKKPRYTPLLNRQRESTVEEKLARRNEKCLG